jgi:hypothetical protein
MKKVARTALLISGSEARFATEQESFASYLESINVAVRVQKYAKHNVILNSMKSAVRNTPDDGILLIAFSGHGSVNGWESASRFTDVTYRKITDLLVNARCRVQFINSTCYAHYLIKELIGRRSATTTGVIATWEGYKVTYDNTIKDVHDAWEANTLPDKVQLIFSSEEVGYDVEFMGVQRWGGIFDSYFYKL